MSSYTKLSNKFRCLLLSLLVVGTFLCSAALGKGDARYTENQLWDLAKSAQDGLVVATLAMRSTMESELATEQGVQNAIDWCKFHGITKIYLETYRNGKQAPREVMIRARDMFANEGFMVSGCITTTNIGKPALHPDENGNMVSGHLACYTSSVTKKEIQNIFEFAASIFDEIIIDDFFCTDCKCDQCTAAKGDRSWPEYRSDIMLTLSKEQVLSAARKVNPDCSIIIKYPNWYDHYISAGYDTDRQTKLFPYIYTGTETREPDPKGLNPQYGGYFIMQWLNAVGQGKNRGGWFDFINTRPNTYVEQARQTVLGGAREIMLFRYASLASAAEAGDINALHKELPQLFKLAKLLKGKVPQGIVAPKPSGSSDRPEMNTKISIDKYLLSYMGMVGLPVVPTVTVPDDAKTALFTQHALYDQDILRGLRTLAERGTPILVTNGLIRDMDNPVDTSLSNVHLLDVGDLNRNILFLPEEKLNSIRDAMLAPLGVKFHAPPRVAIYLFDKDLLVVENFNNQEIQAHFSQVDIKGFTRLFSIPEKSNVALEKDGAGILINIPPRSLTVVTLTDL